MYITLDQAAKVHEVPHKHLLNLYYRDRNAGRDDRFIIENGVVKVHEDFLCPHRQDIETLYHLALESTSGNEKAIAKTIAQKTGKNTHAVYFWLRNFRFKNHHFANVVMNILKEFIQTHNLFYQQGIA